MSEETVTFKQIKKKNLRQRKASSDEDEDKESGREIREKIEKIHETKEKQKLRLKPKGVNAASLAIGKKITLEEEIAVKDPFKIQSGGLVNMQSLKGKIKPVEDPYDTGIGTQFSAETNIGDTDEQMMKYIDEQLSKRKGLESVQEENEGNKYLSPEDAAILSLPKHLRETSSKKNEEMLSNQMLNGIPEVNLGIEAKIKNIEATEEAKQKLLMDQKNKKDLPSQFVPKNMAVNFLAVQHHRFNIEQADQRKKPVNEDDQSNQKRKASDDFHFEKFRKQFRK